MDVKNAVNVAASRAAEVSVSLVQLMTTPMTDLLAVRVVLRRVESTGG